MPPDDLTADPGVPRRDPATRRPGAAARYRPPAPPLFQPFVPPAPPRVSRATRGGAQLRWIAFLIGVAGLALGAIGIRSAAILSGRIDPDLVTTPELASIGMLALAIQAGLLLLVVAAVVLGRRWSRRVCGIAHRARRPGPAAGGRERDGSGGVRARDRRHVARHDRGARRAPASGPRCCSRVLAAERDRRAGTAAVGGAADLAGRRHRASRGPCDPCDRSLAAAPGRARPTLAHRRDRPPGGLRDRPVRGEHPVPVERPRLPGRGPRLPLGHRAGRSGRQRSAWRDRGAALRRPTRDQGIAWERSSSRPAARASAG